jgi:hypothetical protein
LPKARTVLDLALEQERGQETDPLQIGPPQGKDEAAEAMALSRAIIEGTMSDADWITEMYAMSKKYNKAEYAEAAMAKERKLMARERGRDVV